MKITKEKTRRIMLSLLLCGCMSSSVYAADGDIVTLDVESGETYTSQVRNSRGTTIDGYDNCTFENCNDTSVYEGNAIYNGGTITEIKNSYFQNNGWYNENSYAGTEYGGAISNNGTIESITGTEFSGNQVLWCGGAISNYDGTIDLIDDCTFTENLGYDDGGGAIFNEYATINTIQNSAFTNNEAGWCGGAIFNCTEGEIGKIYNCTFTGNVTDWDYGGAINNWMTIGTIDECTFTDNQAFHGGGAIYNGFGVESDEDTYGTITTISNSKFEGNMANWGGAIYSSNYALIGSIYNCEFTGNKATDEHIEDLDPVEALAYGGAIFNYNQAIITSIDQCTFTGNSADDGDGGAIYNYDGATIGSITNSTFTSNTAGQDGGAIYNFWEPGSENGEGIIGSIDNVTFEKNTSANYGGALFNHGYIGLNADGETVTGGITNSTFKNNESGRGGAIYNGIQRDTGDTGASFDSIITTIENCYFYQNNATNFGGAIYNYDDAYIWNISNNIFEENTAQNGNGGAIENAEKGSVIGTIANNQFLKNDVSESDHGGGAIYSEGIITSITGNNFEENKSGNYGGAFYNNGGTIGDTEDATADSITGNTFTGNESGRGGAIYNTANRSVDEDTGDETIDPDSPGIITNINNNTFKGNIADNYGGAIYNYSYGQIYNISDNIFEENVANNGNGGAIENAEATSVIGTIKNNQFLKNDVSMSEHGGGAIYNEGSIDSIGENNFEENTSYNFGGAIYNNGGTIDTDDTGDSISNNTFTGNTSNRGGAIYNTAHRSLDESGTETIDDGTPGVITSIDGNTFSGNIANDFGGAIYNYKYGEIKSITGNTFTENAANGGNGGAIENAEPESVIGEISGNTFVNNTATGGGAAIYNEGTIDSITDNTFQGNAAGTYGGAIYNHGGTITEISGDTFTGNSAVSESGEAAGGAIYNSGSISTFSVKDLTGNYAEGATSAMGGAIYDEGASEITVDGDVTGNYATASSGEALGGAIYAGEGTVVTLSGNITGNSATGTTALGGAIYNAGTVNINIEDQDAVISGNTAVSGGTEEANVLYGEAASVTNFNLTDATLRLDDSLTGETGFEVNISGNGIDATTFYMYNDINDSNLSIGGTTLNTMNGESHTYNVNQFTVAGDFDMQADIDLRNETMDRFVTNGNNYGTAQGTLNVSALNVVSDTSKTRVGVYFAEPGLKEDVTSSVSDVVGPVNTYSVSYDKNYDGSWGDDGGYFVFDKTGTNPAAMMSSVAMAGAYNAMNMMFEYCFEHSDYYMKLPSETRLAIREKAKAARAEKLAAKNGTTVEEESQKIDDARAEEMASREGDKFYDHDNVLPVYDQHELTRPGAWVKTFATKESIPFTGKFTARDKYYGGIIGVDTDFREDKKGWGNVFTGYAGYQGIHQSYSGGSIRQDGGMLGATETFYKKNFYTAWTIAAASTSAKGRNMYGHESSRLYTYGIATKSGWNLEYDGGKYIVLPTFMASYTTVDMRDYTNAAGLKVDADDMRAVQLNPNIKWIRNYNNGWQPYLTAGEVWTVGQKSRVRVNGTKLDELHLRPYTEYGLGVQKRWAHDYDGYAEFLGHAGGRRGFLAKLGFRWTFN